mmetsp:Transcript_112/g.274  ORF Transcript_112/g.274 Transcript_112/m.274 type:complete len:378 (+) Transcript_112:346-1479(+)
MRRCLLVVLRAILVCLVAKVVRRFSVSALSRVTLGRDAVVAFANATVGNIVVVHDAMTAMMMAIIASGTTTSAAPRSGPKTGSRSRRNGGIVATSTIADAMVEHGVEPPVGSQDDGSRGEGGGGGGAVPFEGGGEEEVSIVWFLFLIVIVPWAVLGLDFVIAARDGNGVGYVSSSSCCSCSFFFIIVREFFLLVFLSLFVVARKAGQQGRTTIGPLVSICMWSASIHAVVTSIVIPIVETRQQIQSSVHELRLLVVPLSKDVDVIAATVRLAEFLGACRFDDGRDTLARAFLPEKLLRQWCLRRWCLRRLTLPLQLFFFLCGPSEGRAFASTAAAAAVVAVVVGQLPLSRPRSALAMARWVVVDDGAIAEAEGVDAL